MNAWSQALAAWLADFAWMATALLCVASSLRLLLRDPANRVQLAWATWLSVLGTAVLVASPTWPRWELQRLFQSRTASPPQITAVEQPVPSEPLVLIENAELTAPSASIDIIASSTAVHIAWRELLVITWLTAGIVACGWIAVGFFQAHRLIQTSQPAPAWIVEQSKSIAPGSPPSVRMSPRLSSAIALGTLCPRILLPHSSAEPASVKAVRAALAHEWAHIRHGDLWLLALERWLVPLLALHPIFWWLRRATRLDQELRADAAAAGVQPLEYAEALLAWAKSPPTSAAGLTALAIWDRPTNLTRRVHMILNAKPVKQTWLSRLGGALAASTVLCAALALSVLTAGAQQTAPQQATDEPVIAQNSSAIEPQATPQQATPVQTTAPQVTDPSVALPSVPAPAPAPTTEPLAAPTITPQPQPHPTATNASPFANHDKVLTLKLALFALNRADFPKTRKQVIESVEQLVSRPMVKGAATKRPNTVQPLIAEVDSSEDSNLVMDIQSIEGVKLVSRATIVALSGQQARLNMSEPGPRIEIEEESNGSIVRRDQYSGINYSLSVKPQPLGDGSKWNVEIDVSRGQRNVVQPTTTLRTAVNLGRTLVMVSSEPYALLVTPLKVEPQVTGVRPGATFTIAEAKMAGVPATHPINTPPAGSTILPVPNTFQSTPSTPGAGAFQTAPSLGPTSGTFQTAPSLGPGTFQTNPGLVSAPSTRPGNALTQPLPPTGVEVPRTAHPATATTSPMAVPNNAAQRQLLELDLAEAKLDVQLAEAELADLEEIRKKNPGAASLQELRKRQLQVERAKIQMRRIEIRLDDSKPANSTPSVRTIKPN